jgi:hypothetical protein
MTSAYTADNLVFEKREEARVNKEKDKDKDKDPASVGMYVTLLMNSQEAKSGRHTQ